MAIKKSKNNPGRRVSPEMEQKIRDSIESTIEFGIKNYGDKNLDTLEQFREIAGWYNEAADGKLNRSEAMSTIANHIIEKLIDQISRYLQQAMISGLEIKVGNSKEKIIKKIEVKVAFEHEIEFVKGIEMKEVANCKVTCKIAGAGKLEDVKIHRTSAGTEIEISKFSVPISISITKIKLTILGLPLPKDTLLPKPIPLVKGEPVQFENYSFSV